MRKFPLHDLDDIEFENLATLICRKILGEAVIPFAAGTDGGRDAKFNGKANCFPSESKPWEGKIVIQAKHTTKVNTSCSDSEFQKRLKEEVVPAIDRLKSIKKIDYYLLFTNNKLTGKQDEKIEDLINVNTGVENVVIANEKIQQWLQTYPDIVKEAKLHDLLRPLHFDESDLKSIVLEFQKSLPKVTNDKSNSLSYLSPETKNELNQLSKKYFDDVIKRHFTYFGSIRDFLSDPINEHLKNLYQDTVDELNAKITIKREEYSFFESLLEDLYDYVISSNSEFSKSGQKRLIRVFLNYMYCNCDIGKKEDA